MDVDRRARLARGDERRLHHAASRWSVHGAWQPISPIMPARTSVPQAPSQDLPDHLGGEIVDRAAVVLRVLVVVDVVAAAHDQVHAGAGGDALQASGSGERPPQVSSTMASPPSCFIIATSRRGDVLEVEHVLAAGALQPAAVVHLPDILERDLGAEIVVGARAGRADVAQHVLVHQRAAQRLRLDRARGRSGPSLEVVRGVIASLPSHWGQPGGHDLLPLRVFATPCA